MNSAGLKMIEAESLAQVKGRCVYALVSGEHRKAFEALTRDVFRGESRTLEFKMIGLKGRPLWLHTHAVPMRNEQGEIVSSLAITTDITERKQAEEALRESERSLKTLMGNLPGMAYRCRNDRSWTMEYVSEGVVALTGYRASDLIGNARMAYGDLIHPEDRNYVWNAVQDAVIVRQKFTLNYRVRRADGRERWVWEQGQGVFSEAGDLLALEGFITDVTDSRLLEEQRIKTEKLESIGTLAGGIAHDFNNLLQGVFGYLSMARLTLDQRERSLAMLAQAEKALHQAVNLTSHLLTFSKGGKPVKRVIDLRPVIENAVQLALSGSRVEYHLSLAQDLRAVEADAGQLAQVLQNIVLNADQAMPLGGTVRVAARNMAAFDAPLLPGMQAVDVVEITIRDQGTGIPPEHLARIFDPYFTTKEKGSGLGLATSYSIIKNHGGMLSVSSELGKGSVFTIHLPSSAQAPIAAGADAASPVAARAGRVLVMDDEAMVREVAGDMLREQGHDVEFAVNGEEAVERFREAKTAGRPFDVVLLDITVRGGLGGIETVQRLRKIDPAVRAVASSGYAEDAVGSDYLDRGFSAFLKKPYTSATLQDVLHKLLS